MGKIKYDMPALSGTCHFGTRKPRALPTAQQFTSHFVEASNGGEDFFYHRKEEVELPGIVYSAAETGQVIGEITEENGNTDTASQAHHLESYGDATDEEVSRGTLPSAPRPHVKIHSVQLNEDETLTVKTNMVTYQLIPIESKVDLSQLPKTWGQGRFPGKFDWKKYDWITDKAMTREQNSTPTITTQQQSLISENPGVAGATNSAAPDTGTAHTMAVTGDNQSLARVEQAPASEDEGEETKSDDGDLYHVPGAYSKILGKGPPRQAYIPSEDEEKSRNEQIQSMMPGFCSAPTPTGDRSKWKTNTDKGLLLMLPSQAQGRSPAAETDTPEVSDESDEDES